MRWGHQPTDDIDTKSSSRGDEVKTRLPMGHVRRPIYEEFYYVTYFPFSRFPYRSRPGGRLLCSHRVGKTTQQRRSNKYGERFIVYHFPWTNVRLFRGPVRRRKGNSRTGKTSPLANGSANELTGSHKSRKDSFTRTSSITSLGRTFIPNSWWWVIKGICSVDRSKRRRR